MRKKTNQLTIILGVVLALNDNGCIRASVHEILVFALCLMANREAEDACSLVERNFFFFLIANTRIMRCRKFAKFTSEKIDMNGRRV